MKKDYSEFRASVAADTELKGVITGQAFKYGVDIPRGPGLFERVEPGTFAKQMRAANRVAVLWQHQRDNPIGRATELRDVDGALRFKAKITRHEDVPEARKALALLDEGVVDEISVGFEWGQWREERNEETGSITIVHTKARLDEFSVVTFGALGRDATVKTVASEGAGVAPVISVAAYRARLARLNS